MKELDEYLDAVSKRKPRLVSTGQVNIATLMVLVDDDVPRLVRMLKMAVAQLETELENCTAEGQAVGLETCFFDLRRLTLAGCTGRVGAHVPPGWFRTKPNARQAVRWAPAAEIPDWMRGAGYAISEDGTQVHIKTPEGTMTANQGDWIVRGLKGEIYPVKDEQFQLTYEPA